MSVDATLGHPRAKVGWHRSWPRLTRVGFWVLLTGFAAWLVWRSWMRWVDPQIDFGVQLYIPWRITLGEHLGRDFVHPYGPFSSYFNASLFAVFGTSIRTLVVANLVIYAAIVTLWYAILRRTFGFLPAAVATWVGIAVFAFGHYTGVNNYTYAAPYAHEATHGLLFLLLLVSSLLAENPGNPVRRGGIEGVVFALICLTKVEIAVAAVLVLIVAAIRRRGTATHGADLPRWAAAFGAGFAGVLVIGWVALAAATSGREALMAVTSGFLGPLLYPSYVRSSSILGYLGLDHPLENIRAIVISGAAAFALLAAVVLLSRSAARLPSPITRWAWLAGAVVTACVVTIFVREPPFRVAWSFPFLLAGAAGWIMVRARREATTDRVTVRTWALLISFVAASALMLRMALAPKIQHYGFVQAMLAATWLAAFLLGELPREWVSARAARRLFLGITAAALCFGAARFTRLSLGNYSAKNLPMGVGADRIFGFGLNIFVAHDNLEAARAFLQPRLTPSSTLLVAPEGILLNYWTRTKWPLRITNLLPATVALNRGDVLEELTREPPDYVVVATRTVSDDSFPPFGADEASGQRILAWLEQHYVKEAHAGQDPLRPFAENKFGLWILKRKPAG
jgi:hypothetical protein